MDLWIEKYRPNTFNDVLGQKDTIEKLKAMAKAGEVQHMILSGPPGVGKTTSAIVLAKTIFSDQWSHNFIELNASDDRKLSVIQGKVKEFARSKPIDAPFKMILFDEADSLTQEAQQALRRMMEEYSGTCRFIFSVNYQNNIIEPIQSRCAIFRFRSLSEEDVYEFIDKIAEKESLEIDDEAKKALFFVSKGDLRALTNLMQSLSTVSKEIEAEVVYKSSGTVNVEQLKKAVELALSGRYLESKVIISSFIDQGVGPKELISEIFELITSSNVKVDEKMKGYIVEKLAESEYRIVEGATPFIQLQSFFAFLSSLKR
ncbi:replication factor C small subunit [Candidatus Parvarchaeota archaeon]|jgi:replication factor C small subunit|uniref:Replication factor C small subunit n=1 Tax=Candidatus Acidifodinimicrobium mancum TaxID=2898728 RepID=A0A8T3UVG7_9ARCH|nr:replication factor C small subunit [Candidatus Acidifodinimicrobium mancum]MBE5729081.1 replication factor C small subunit [Candidatus Acidifodinimicrobium mancum]MBE5729636.1 replication factor C small subunit [Candidatus Acidifodinimicrobium mancum]MBE5729807.1 replication factor C small subunit [Candidatus Acidifodinimicrobium mancum]